MVEVINSYKVENFSFDKLEQAEKYEELVNKYNFTPEQKEKIYEGLKDNLNVDWYAKPEFDSIQMYWIYKGLKNNNPFVRFYANLKYNSIQMQRFYYNDSVDFEFRMFKKSLFNEIQQLNKIQQQYLNKIQQQYSIKNEKKERFCCNEKESIKKQNYERCFQLFTR